MHMASPACTVSQSGFSVWITVLGLCSVWTLSECFFFCLFVIGLENQLNMSKRYLKDSYEKSEFYTVYVNRSLIIGNGSQAV